MIDMEMKNYVDWDVKSVIRILDRDRYAFRVVLIYRDGSKRIRQHSGFLTKREAECARKNVIAELVNQTYIVNVNVKLEEFLVYWLEYDIRQRAGSSNTYVAFKNIVKRHIIPMLGKKKLVDIHMGDVQRLYQDRAEYSHSIAKQTKTVMNKLGLPDIRWHDLRSSFCTLLLKNDFNPKAVSNLMGHAKEIITMDVYGDNANIISEEIPELQEYMEEVLPEADSDQKGEEVEDIMIDMDGFLPL